MGTNFWTDELLESLRSRGDGPADTLARSSADQFPMVLRRLMTELVDNRSPVPASVPEALRRFLEEGAALPAWADREQIRLGQHIFGRYGLQLIVALLCASLPECYAAAKGAQTLRLSARFVGQTRRRVLETAQFVLDVMAPGGLGPEGRGVRSAQKVRLVHAMSRIGIAHHPEFRPEWGVPVNQEDQLGVLMSFSTVALEALKRLGVDFTRDEEDAYVHAWAVTGHLLGMETETLPESAASARALFERIRDRHCAPSAAGRELTRALVETMEEVVPGTFFDGIVTVLIRHLVGDRVADAVGVDRGDWTKVFVPPLRIVNAVLDKAGDHSPRVARGIEVLSRRFLEHTYRGQSGSEPIQFHVPGELRARWGLS